MYRAAQSAAGDEAAISESASRTVEGAVGCPARPHVGSTRGSASTYGMAEARSGANAAKSWATIHAPNTTRIPNALRIPPSGTLTVGDA